MVRARYGLAWGFGLVGVVVSCALGWMLDEWAGRQDRARFSHEASMLAALLEQKMERYESGLARVRDACSPSGGRVGRGTWLGWLNGSLDIAANFEGIGAVVVASREPGPMGASGERGSDSFVVRQSTGYGGLLGPVPGEDLLVATNDRPSLQGALASTFGWVPMGRSWMAKADGTREEGFWYAVAARDLEPGSSIVWRNRGETEEHAAARRARQRAERATGLLAAFIRGDRFLRSFASTNSSMAHVWLYPDRKVGPGDRPLNAGLSGPVAPVFTEDVVMLVDDHAVVRVGLANLVRDDPGMTVVGEAGSCAEALAMVSEVRPEVVVLDVRLPDGSGIDLIGPIKERVPGVRVVILTSYAEDALVLAALRKGADGYLLKDVSAGELVEGLRRSIQAGVVSPSVRVGEVAGRGGMVRKQAEVLTGQEQRVCEFVGRGLSNREVAESIGISEKTVRNYLTRVFEKLGIRRRSELVALFVARKFGRTG